MELPQDLDETYNRCLSWIAKTKRYREIAPQILSWICETVAPFKIGELQEALAINTKTGCLEKDRLVPESEIIKSCGNLISCPKNSGRRITVVHHSALLFLRDRFAGDNGLFAHEPTEVEKITPLGNLCVIHLQSPDYTLAVQVHQPASQSMQLNISAITNNPELPAFARWLFRTYAGSDVVIQTVRRPHKLPTKRAESFFDFARKHWAPLTTDLTDDSSIWTMFQELALQPNTSWKMHPWPAHKDIDSHVLGLLGCVHH
ncbi:hypothetical protein J1614_011438 [Plenodomus biglobosus]|nr:hypothetical protein J1614_011438 [Plenodomus biglobosus]